MRNIVDVIDSILSLIPSDKEDLIVRLNSARSSAAFSAPELMHLRWDTMSELLSTEIPFPPKEEWEIKVVALFMDQPEDELRVLIEEHKKKVNHA